MAFRLQTLLDLKLRAEEDAERCLAEAMAFHAKVEARQQALENQVTKARQQLTEARAGIGGGGGDRRGSAGAGTIPPAAGRGGAAEDGRGQGAPGGPPGRGQAPEQEARDKHLEARREREALEKHKEKEAAKVRVVAERRAEDAASDLAIAAHFRKQR